MCHMLKGLERQDQICQKEKTSFVMSHLLLGGCDTGWADTRVDLACFCAGKA